MHRHAVDEVLEVDRAVDTRQDRERERIPLGQDRALLDGLSSMATFSVARRRRSDSAQLAAPVVDEQDSALPVHRDERALPVLDRDELEYFAVAATRASWFVC